MHPGPFGEREQVRIQDPTERRVPWPCGATDFVPAGILELILELVFVFLRNVQ